MYSEVRDAWVTALRSGRYLQAKSVLAAKGKDGIRHCVLGVLCDLAADAGVCKRVVLDPNSLLHCIGYSEGPRVYWLVIPHAVAEWAGLPERHVAVPFNGKLTALQALNDDEGLSFKQLADLIERHL